MQNKLSDDKDYNLWVLLHQTKDAIFRAREKELRKYGISTMRAGVLFIINAVGGKATITEISRWLFREPHSVSGLLSRMEKEGLVRRVNNLGKKNQVNFAITAKGKKAFSDSLKRESIRKIISCLSKEEHQQLLSSLQKLRDNALENLHEVRKLPFPYPR